MANYGLTLTGTIRVFRKDKEIQGNGKKKFTVTDVWFNTSEKEDNGDYFNISTNLIFNKALDKPENNSVITIKEGFPIITGTGKFRKVAFYVKDYTVEPTQFQKAQAHLNGSTTNNIRGLTSPNKPKLIQ